MFKSIFSKKQIDSIVNMFNSMFEKKNNCYEYSAFITSDSSGIVVNRLVKNTFPSSVSIQRTETGAYTFNFPDMPNKEVMWSIGSSFFTTPVGDIYKVVIDGNSFISIRNLYILASDESGTPTDSAFTTYLLEIKAATS